MAAGDRQGKEVGVDAAAQLDYWRVFLTSREAAIRELQAHGYEVMIDCFIDGGPVVYWTCRLS
jgi:hypothetical protein